MTKKKNGYSSGCRKTFDTIQYSFMITAASKLVREGNSLIL